MAVNSSTALVITLLDSLKSILNFPLWWYTRGFFDFTRAVFHSIANFNKSLGFTIWLKNILTPLFGQDDLAGRIVSFFLRLFNIIFRGIWLLILIAFHLLAIALWLALPLIIIWQIITH